MSRASEWAKQPSKHLLAHKPTPNHPGQECLVLVERSGDCYLEITHVGSARVVVGASFVPEQALALAAWLIATFGEDGK